MDAQDKELAQLHDNMVEDLYGLIYKYMGIVGLDVPENDEKEALKKIVQTMKEALENVQKATDNMESVEVIGDEF
jgi:methionyl-tRNA synthetase